MLWFTSDLHIGHRKVIEFCNRPYADVDEMHEGIIANWNARVRKNDIVYVLGDVSFTNATKTKEVMDRLKGRKILILGNHDAAAHKMLAMGFDEVYENHKIKIAGREILLSHFPYYPAVDSGEDRRYLHKRITDDGGWLLVGHVHTAWAQKDKMINVGVDVRDYAPMSHEKILAIIEKYEEALEWSHNFGAITPSLQET